MDNMKEYITIDDEIRIRDAISAKETFNVCGIIGGNVGSIYEVRIGINPHFNPTFIYDYPAAQWFGNNTVPLLDETGRRLRVAQPRQVHPDGVFTTYPEVQLCDADVMHKISLYGSYAGYCAHRIGTK